MKLNKLEVLEKNEIELIHGESLKLLEKIGIKVESEEARDLLQENGAIIDNSTNFVKLPEELITEQLKHVPNKFTMWGSDGSFNFEINTKSVNFATVGTPVKGMEIKISEKGEILMRGIGVFQGYFRDPQATTLTLKDGWLYSEDVGHVDEDGHLVITDRMKDILITAGGKNLSPSEIENELKFSPYINEAIVIGDRRKYLTALIQLEYDTVADWAQKNRIPFTTFKSLAKNQDVRDLIAKEVRKANEHLSQVETIKKFSLLEKELDHDDGEITATKKVKRKIIAEIYKEQIDSMYQGA